jgi:hypothetical protein
MFEPIRVPLDLEKGATNGTRQLAIARRYGHCPAASVAGELVDFGHAGLLSIGLLRSAGGFRTTRAQIAGRLSGGYFSGFAAIMRAHSRLAAW